MLNLEFCAVLCCAALVCPCASAPGLNGASVLWFLGSILLLGLLKDHICAATHRLCLVCSSQTYFLIQ